MMLRRISFSLAFLVACSSAGSSSSSSSGEVPTDGGTQGGGDAGADAETDGAADGGSTDGGDAQADADLDAGADADPDAGPSDVGQLLRVVGGENATCALYATGRVYCFGGNDSGQLGRGNTTDVGGEAGTMSGVAPVDLGPGAFVKEIAMGARHVCARLATGKVKCWGSNSQGELGLGDKTIRGNVAGQMGAALPEVDLGVGRTAKRISLGYAWSCAILDDDSLKCWGRNANGQLGQGVSTPFIGDGTGEMAALAPIDLGPGRTALDVVSGEQHVCALLDDHTVKCWGANGEGQLGQGDTQVRGIKSGQMGASLPAIDLGPGRTAKEIWAGGFHNCALLDDDQLKCWGGNVAGQLGLGDNLQRGAATGEMGATLPKLDLGSERKAIAMKLGQEYSCALLDNGSLKCFGNDFYGQLGYGDTVKRGDGAGEMGDLLPAVDFGPGTKLASVGGGTNHVCVVSNDAKLRCWGANISGQLGVGDRNPRGDGPEEMGAKLLPVPLP